MLNGLYSAASGMLAQQTRMDMLANDLANLNTTGYKQARIGFRDLIYNTEQGMRGRRGLRRSSTPAATMPRARFQADRRAALARHRRSRLLPGAARRRQRRADPLRRLPHRRERATSSTSPATGSCRRSASRPAPTSTSSRSRRRHGPPPARRRSARSRSSTSRTPAASRRSATTLFAPTADSGDPHAVAGSQLQQGYLEASNVDLAQTMVALIDAQRSYEMDSRAIQNQDQMMQVANQIRQ